MKVGVIGGGYFGKYWGTPAEVRRIETALGPPADNVCVYSLSGKSVYTLQRHGARHQLSPDKIPWKANALSMRLVGADLVIHVTACGALTEDGSVGDLVLFDQMIDFTKTRPCTLGRPIVPDVSHISVSEPISSRLLGHVSSILRDSRIEHRVGGTMVTIEGPRFATRAESRMFRLLGGTLINMTSAPEVFLLHEMAIPVVGVALITDLDNQPEDPDERVRSKLVTDNIHRFRRRVPEAIRAVVAGLEPSMLTRSRVEALDVCKLDTRS